MIGWIMVLYERYFVVKTAQLNTENDNEIKAATK